MNALLFVHKAITHSYVRTALVCLNLTVLLTFSPSLLLLICGKSQCDNILHLDYVNGTITDKNYISKWLLISIIITIPMACNVLLDIPKQICNIHTRDIIIYRIILVVANIVPAIILYFTLEYEGQLMHSLRFTLRDTQVLCTIISLQLTIFCSQSKIEDIQYKELKHKLGDIFMYFLTTLVISRLCSVLTLTVFRGNFAFLLLASIINNSNTFLSYVCYVALVYYIVKEKYFPNSNSNSNTTTIRLDVDTKFSDLFHCLALILNTFFNVTITIFFYNDLFLHLYAQIILILVMTAIPLEFNLLQAEIKEVKLGAKLNMLRYVSHEMRTPLNIAILGSKVVMDNLVELSNKLGDTSPEISVTLTTNNPILKNGQKLLNNLYLLVNDVLDLCQQDVSTLDDVLTFDKLDEKKLSLEKELISNPYTLIESVVDDSEAIIRDANLTISFQCIPEYDNNWLDGSQLFLDQCKIAQVLRNLISNAVKFTPPNGQIIIILEKKEFLNSSDESSLIRISVSDTGQGISQEVLSRLLVEYAIFDPNAPQNKRNKCAGLGLWISKCKSLVVHSFNTIYCMIICACFIWLFYLFIIYLYIYALINLYVSLWLVEQA